MIGFIAILIALVALDHSIRKDNSFAAQALKYFDEKKKNSELFGDRL